MPKELGFHYLDSVRASFRKQRALAEAALEQVMDEDFFRALSPGSNSLAIIVKHVAGNLKSRWTRFLDTDGEKPDRNRDREFEDDPSQTRLEVMDRWHEGWSILFQTIDGLAADDLLRSVTVRNEPLTVVEAITRQIDHYGNHAGQIVYLAKYFAGDRWVSLSVPRKPRGHGQPKGQPK